MLHKVGGIVNMDEISEKTRKAIKKDVTYMCNRYSGKSLSRGLKDWARKIDKEIKDISDKEDEE